MTTVYYTSSFVPPELITACGCIPHRLIADIEDRRVSQTEGMCLFTEGWLETVQLKCTNDNTAAIFTTSCDQMRRAYDLYCCKTNNNSAFLLNVPSTNTQNAFNYYLQELKRLQDFLCSLSGCRFDEKRLQISPTTSPPGEFAQNNNQLRLAVIGEAISDSVYRTLDDILKSIPAEIALDITDDKLMYHDINNCTVPIQTDQISNLASRYFHIPAVWKRPNIAFFDYLNTLIQNHHIDGVLLFRYIFCDLWHSAVYEIKKRLLIPILEIDLDAGELSASSVSRIQSFMEILAQ